MEKEKKNEKEKEWTIDATAVAKNSIGKDIIITFYIKEKYYTKSEAKERIDKIESDLYEYKLPVRFNGVIVRPVTGTSKRRVYVKEIRYRDMKLFLEPICLK